MMTLGDMAPVLRRLRAKLAEPPPGHVYSDDIPADYLRYMLGLPEDAPVSSRVDQLWQANRRTDAIGCDTYQSFADNFFHTISSPFERR